MSRRTILLSFAVVSAAGSFAMLRSELGQPSATLAGESPKKAANNEKLIPKPIPGEGECDPKDPAHAEKLKLIGPEFNLGPGTLKGQPIPEPSNLGEFVKDKQIAIVLGKALFWDMQVGSDGIQALPVATSAGADPRSVNQLAPGGTGRDNFFDEHFEAKSRFSVSNAKMTTKAATHRTFDVKPINSRLDATDFPLHKLQDPTDRSSRVIHDYDDVVSSQGVILNTFSRAGAGSPHDLGNPRPDPVFNINGVNTRRVEPRNTPTVINAIFNHRNFWDGRAQEIFNGRNVTGVRDGKGHGNQSVQPPHARSSEGPNRQRFTGVIIRGASAQR